MSDPPPTNPPSRSTGDPRIAPWRVVPLGIGLFLILVAFYIFYAQPWLSVSLPIDIWLAQQSCLVDALCHASFPQPHHLGTLAILGALVLFVAALWRPDSGTSMPANVTPLRIVWITFLTLVGLACIGVQAYQTVSDGQFPDPWLWLIGILGLATAALFWDMQTPAILAQTAAGLAVGIGITGILIAIGVAIAQPSAMPWLLLPGLLLVLGGAWMTREGDLDPVDLGIMLGLGILALLLGVSRIWSWRYAFVGDEWGFFDLATTLIHRPELHTLFSVVDANAYHTVFSAALQAGIMRLASENVYGWRLSSLLPMVLSVPAVYVFTRWLSGRTAAIVAAGLLAASHMLLSFSMVAYNNTQALLPLTIGLAMFAFAERRESALRYYALGTILGSAFLLFGLARLVLLPIGILVIFFYWSTWQRALTSTLAIGAGMLAVATPLLFNLNNWRGLLKATPVQSEAAPGAFQLVRNIVGGGQAFFASSHNTHFVVGPHVDPLTAVLLLIGLATAIAGWRQRSMMAWLIASLTFWLAVSAIQQYEWVSTTRMFVLVPIYAIFAGLGAAAIGRLFFSDNLRKGLAWAGSIVTAALLINQFHITSVANPQLQLPVQALLVREFQESAASDGSGLPIYVVWEQPSIARENMILSAYGIEPDRIRFMTPDEALTAVELCDDQRAQMLLVHARIPQFNALRDRIDACWPIHEEMELRADSRDILLFRFTTKAGVQDITKRSRPPAYRQTDKNLWVADPGDAVVDGAGHLFVLAKQLAVIEHFDEAGKSMGSFDLLQDQPSAMALTTDGHLLVSHVGPDAALIWYDGDGNAVRRLPTSSALAAPVGLAVTEDGDILVADAALRQVLRLAADGQLQTIHTGGGQLQQPVAITASDDGSFWVLDSVVGEWLKISRDDEVLAILRTDRTSPASPPRLVVAADGSVLFTEPDRHRVVHKTADDQLLDLWGGFQRPSGIATDEQGRIYVVDEQLDRVVPIELESVNFEKVRPAVVTGTESPISNSAYSDLDSSPFLSPISPLLSGADTTMVADQRYLPLADSTGLTIPRAIGLGATPGSIEPRIFVGDSAGGGMAILSASGQIAGSTSPDGPYLEEIADIAVDPNGRIYVLDSRRGQLHRFSPDGVYLSSVPGDHSRYGDARGLFVDSKSDIWIARTRQGNIVQLDSDGNELAQIPILQDEGSQPVDVVAKDDGTLFVAEARTARLLHLTRSGELLDAWSLSPFNSADGAHLALDGEGNIYVTQPEQGVVILISPDGTQRRSWLVRAPDGSHAKPVGVDIDLKGNIWTVDVDGNGVIMIETGE